MAGGSSVVGALRVVLGLDSAEFNSGLNKAKKDLGRAGKDMEALSRQMSRLGQQLAVGVAAGAAAAGAAIVKLGDTYSSLQGRLSLVTKGTEDLARASNALFKVAQDTRGSFEGTVDLYTRLSRATQSLGVSQDELVKVTKTINQTLVISGASAEAANAALMQLGQGFASGTLRGEELNSVLEQTPRLAQAIADGLGVSIGKLRELGKEGKLTAETVLSALQSQAAAVESEFAKMPPTVSQAMQLLRNEMLRFTGETNEALGVTRRLSAVIVEATKHIADVASVIGKVLAAGLVLATARLGALTAAYVANTAAAVANAAAQIAIGTALAGMSARAVAATAAVGALRVAWGAMAAVLGGPVGVAIAAVAGGLLLMRNHGAELDRKNREMVATLGGARGALDRYREAAIAAALASGEGAEQARAHAASMREEAAAAVRATMALRNKALVHAIELSQRAAQARQEALARGPTSQANVAFRTGEALRLEADAKRAREAYEATAKAADEAKKELRSIAAEAEALRKETDRSAKSARGHASATKEQGKAARDAAKEIEDLRDRVEDLWKELESGGERAIRKFHQDSRDLRRALEKGLLTDDQYRETMDRLWNQFNPVTGMKAPAPGGDLKTMDEAKEEFGRFLEDQEREYEASLDDMGRSFRGFFQEMITTGRADWKRLLLDLTSDWKGTMKVLSRLGTQIGGGLGSSLSGLAGILSKIGGAVTVSAMGLGSGNALADLGLGLGGYALGGALGSAAVTAGSMGSLGALSGTALAYGSMLGPIGAIAGVLLGGLLGKRKPSNQGALATFSGDRYSISGNKRTSETEAMAKAAADAIMQGQAMLRAAGATLTATVQSIDIGTRDATDIILSNGRALTAAVGDAAAAAETALMAVLDGASFANEAQEKLVASMRAAGAGFDEIVTQLAQFAEAQAQAAGLAQQFDDAILQLTDAQAYELRILEREQAARRAHIKALLDGAVITEAVFAGLSAQLDLLESLELAKLKDSFEKPADEFGSAISRAADSARDAADRLKEAHARLVEFVKGLDAGPLSPLGPVGQAAAAQRAFREAVASGSDDMAAKAQAYLEAARAAAPDMASYLRAVAEVRGAAAGLPMVDVGSFGPADLSARRVRVGESGRLSDGAAGGLGVTERLARLEDAMVAVAGHTGKMARQLDRFDGEGMPVRGVEPGSPVETVAA